jgi:uncharacterized membrane protein
VGALSRKKMTLYLLLKWIHILSSVVLVGTGFGTAYFMFYGNRSKSVAAQAVVTRLVVRADLWFTTPAGVVQPITGVWIANLAGFSLNSPWLLTSILLYLLAGACWLPVLWLQWRMAALARQANDTGTCLPDIYAVYARWWEALGYPAFLAMLGIFYLMVNKPSLWG